MEEYERFLKTAREFAAWCEGDEPVTDLFPLLQLLSRLYAQGLELPMTDFDPDLEGGAISHEEWHDHFRRIGARLPFGYYKAVMEPFELDKLEDPAGVADLADDLADIHRDLLRGFFAADAGDPQTACFAFRQSLWIHWGEHATSAIHALQLWTQDEQ